MAFGKRLRPERQFIKPMNLEMLMCGQHFIRRIENRKLSKFKKIQKGFLKQFQEKSDGSISKTVILIRINSKMKLEKAINKNEVTSNDTGDIHFQC